MPLDATSDPFAAVGAVPIPSSQTAIPSSPGPNPSSSARIAAGAPVIDLPRVAGAVPIGNGEYAIGQSAAPVTADDPNVIDVSGARPTPAASPAGQAGTLPTPPTRPAPASSDPFAALGAIPVPAAAAATSPVPAGSGQPAAGSGRTTGYLANIGAGTSEAVAGLLGLPVDVVTSIANLVPRGINAVAGTNIPTIQNPVGGSAMFEKAFGLIGANPENIAPGTPGEALARAAARGAVGVALPGGIASKLVRAGMTSPALSMLAAGAGPGGAAAGAGGGVTGYAAAQAAPPEYASLADTLGNIIGGGLTAAGEAGASAIARIGQAAYQRMRQPMNLGAKEPLIDPATGQPFAGAGGAPIAATAGQQQIAGQRIAAAAGQSPAAAAAAIPAPADATLVRGSTPTVGQATGNLGTLGLERTQRTANRAPFTQAEAENAVARVRALQGLAGPQAAGTEAGRFFADRLARLRALADALDRSAAESSKRVAEQLGGAPAEMGEQELGQAHRAALEALREPIRAAISRLYAAVDPDGTLALNVAAVREAAKAALAEINGRFATGSEAEMKALNGAAALRDVEFFSEMRDLDKALSAAQRAIKTDPKLGAESEPFRRVTMVRTALDDAMIEGAADEATEEAAAAKGGSDKPTVGQRMATLIESVPSAGNSVFTPTGREVGVRYRLAEAGDLIASHDDDLKVNPSYPPELQPRDRTRAASQAQVQRIAGNLQPERLGVSATAGDGAPIIGPDGVVESGNARVLALRRVLAAGKERAAQYRDWLKAQGFETEGMTAPVLVRERTTPLSPEERARFTEEANAPTGLAMSATEQAAVDAGRISDATLHSFKGGDVDLAQNAAFVRNFVRDVLEPGQEGSLATHGGALSTEGAQRVRNALIQRAYGDRSLTAALAETGDENIRALGGALMDAAGDMARLRADIAAGRVDAAMEFGPALAEAASIVGQARRSGGSLADHVAQADAFNGISQTAEDILRTAYGADLKGRVNRARLAATLSDYARIAGEQSTAPRLLGENLTRAQALREAEARNAATQGGGAAAGANQPAGGGGVRQGNGAVGPQARGPGAGAPGAGISEQAQAPAAVQVGRNNAAVAPQLRIVEPQLEPNFTPEARARLRAANAAYREYKGTFRRGAVGDVLRSTAGGTGFRAAESSVPATLFRGGPQGAEAADSLIRAAGSPEAAVELLGDYPAFSFRRSAEENGVINPKKAAAWIDKNKAALDKLPGLRERFADAAKATESAEAAAKVGQDAIKAYQQTAARHFLTKTGEAIEPQAAIERLVASPTAERDARDLIRAVASAGDIPAEDGIKRAFVDYLLTKARSTAEAGTTGEKEIAGGVFQRWMADPQNAGVARAILGPFGADTLAKIGKDIERAARAVNATKIPGSPGTASDLVASLRQGAHGFGLVGQLAAAEMVGAVAEHVIGGAGQLLAVPAMLANAMRLAGLETVNDLVTQGLLQPELGRLLLSKAPLKEGSAALNTLLGRIAAAGVSASTAKGQR